MGNPYEAYVNGTLVGRFGTFPPHVKTMRPLVRSFSIPNAAVPGDSMVIAVRFFSPSVLNGGWGGLRTSRPIVLGAKDVLEDAFAAHLAEVQYPWLPDICVRFVSMLLAIGLLILFWWQRQFTEYVWIACYFFAMTAWTVFVDYQTAEPISLQARSFFDTGLTSIAKVFLLQFAFAFLKRPMPPWLRIYQISLLFQLVMPALVFAGWTRETTADLVALIWNMPYAFLLPAVVLWRYLRGHREAGLLAIPLFLININDMLNELGWLLFQLKLRNSPDDLIPPFDIGVVTVYIGQVEGLLFVVSIGALLIYRFHRTSQQQARAQAELEAARSMQEVMVPKRLHRAAGFVIESAYIPAQEVGGDFFQLFPNDDGSLLVVIGDVSGKGVKAAMLVSMILGLLQKTVETVRSPAQILRDLNRCLIGQTDGKFATCCCALMSPDGHVTAANAGHLSPYSDGVELELPGGLPLGLSIEADYEEIELNLPAGKRWLFLSDGVVEARSKSGELYGFERTRGLSILAVNKIAETAQQFGQEDDITVLGIKRQEVAFA